MMLLRRNRGLYVSKRRLGNLEFIMIRKEIRCIKWDTNLYIHTLNEKRTN